MIEIKLADEALCSKICRENDIAVSAGVKIYVAHDGGETPAFCIFEAEGSKGRILKIQILKSGYAFLTDGLLRSALNFMLLHGVKKSECLCETDPRLLKQLGFEKEDGKWSAAVTEDMFKHCCG